MSETQPMIFDSDAVEALAAGGDTAARLARQLAGERTILERIAKGQELQDTLRNLTGLIENVSPGAIASVLLVDEKNCLRHGAAPRVPREFNDFVDGIPIGPTVGSCGTAAYTGDMIITPDIQSDDRWPLEAKQLASRCGLVACWSVPVRDDHGQVVGTFATYFSEPRAPGEQEIHEVEAAAHLAGVAITKSRNEQKLRDSERRFRRLVETAADSIFVFDLEGAIVDVNIAACESLGYTHDELVSLRVADIEVLISEEECRQRWTALVTDAKQVDTFEGAQRCKDGTVIPVEGRLAVLHDDGHTLLVALTRDITQRKLDEERQRLMMRELDHRVKNNLAAVLSIAQQTLTSATSLDEFSETFLGRVRSMAIVHDMLALHKWAGGSLREIVDRMLAPYSGRQAEQIHIDGPPCMIAADIVQPLCMTLHELATNAAKHGALSTSAGMVELTWGVESTDESDARVLRMLWREKNGPPVAKPDEAGFGMQLILEMIRHQLSGSVELVFQPGGVECTITIPLGSNRAE